MTIRVEEHNAVNIIHMHKLFIGCLEKQLFQNTLSKSDVRKAINVLREDMQFNISLLQHDDSKH